MYAAFADYWEWSNQSDVTFHPEERLIIVNPGVTSITIKEDVYSNWKEWIQLYDYTKHFAALRGVGGDPTVAGQYLGSTFFLINGWKMRTWEGDHRLIVEGNLYSEDGLNPFMPTLGNWNTTVQLQVSNLIDRLDNAEVADLVWDVLSSEHQITGSKGKEMRDTLKLIKILVANM